MTCPACPGPDHPSGHVNLSGCVDYRRTADRQDDLLGTELRDAYRYLSLRTSRCSSPRSRPIR